MLLRAVLAVGACALGLMTLTGCDLTLTAPPIISDEPFPPVDEPADGGTNPDGEPVNPPGLGGATSKSVAMRAQRVFCCNPLSYDFAAQLGEGTSAYGVTFEWDFGDRRTARGTVVAHTFPWPQSYQVRLTAHFPDGTSQTVERTIVAGETDPIPGDIPGAEPGEGGLIFELQARAGEDIEVFPGALVLLNGSNSKGTGRHELRFKWEQVQGPSVALESAFSSLTSFVAPDTDEDDVLLAFELTVSEEGSVAADVVGVRVSRRPNAVVVASAGPNQQVQGGTVVLLDGTESRGAAGRELTYQWIQTGGPTVTLVTPNESQTSFLAPLGENVPFFVVFELIVTQGTTSASDAVQIEIAPAQTTPPASPEQVLAWFRELPELPKVHYSWPLSGAWLDTADEEWLGEYARIAHSLCVWAEWVNQEQFNKIIRVCRKVNEGDPEIPVTIGVVMKPWSRIFPASAPPTYRGTEHDKEIQLFRDRLNLVKDWLNADNAAAGGPPVELSAVIMETERFEIKPDDDPERESWNNAITEKQNAVYSVAEDIFPEARIEWYHRGLSRLFTLRERGEAYSVPLYRVPERGVTRAQFRRTAELADENGIEDVTPWVALGAAYVNQPDGSRIWSFAYDYDLVYSWHVGAEINDPWFGDRPDQFAPWHRAKVVVFWPSPSDERVQNWPRHFVAYVRGAHNITELPR